MQSLMMFVDELSYRLPPAADRTLVDKIEASAHALSNLMNGLLDICSIDAGATVARPADVPLAQILAAIEARFADPARVKGIGLTVLPTRATVRSDPVLLIRILSNLVSNAVRYTDAGRVLVGCRRRGTALLLQVADTGVGIAPEVLPLIFEEYYQVANAARDRRRGTGLGLAIVDRLADLLGHEVSVQSRPGRGSVFTVRLPLAAHAPCADPMPVGEPAVDGGGALVVVVEDDPDVRHAVERALKNRHYTVLPASSAREAVELVRWAGRPPAAIVADYRLGSDDTGLDAIAALRALHPATPMAAIVLTGEQRTEVEPPAGVLVLRKPLPPAALCAAIERLRPRHTGGSMN